MKELGRVAGSGRVGQPVFLRCVFACPREEAMATAARGLAFAARIIGDRPRALFARGEPAAGDLHVLLDFEGGPSALIAVGPGKPAWDAMLLGNHGAAYLEDASCVVTGEAEAPVVGRWSSVVQEALAAGRPMAIEGMSDA
jgi:hypothetical protein